jgi:hypothetical protein
MTKRTFDLGVAITVGIITALALPRLWATRRLMEGPAEGMGYTTAKVVKVITA